MPRRGPQSDERYGGLRSQGVQDRFEFGGGLVPFALDHAAGDDAGAGVHDRGRPVEAGAAQRHRELAVAGGVDPAHRARVAIARDRFVLSDQFEREVAGDATDGRRGVEGPRGRARSA